MEIHTHLFAVRTAQVVEEFLAWFPTYNRLAIGDVRSATNLVLTFPCIAIIAVYLGDKDGVLRSVQDEFVPFKESVDQIRNRWTMDT